MVAVASRLHPPWMPSAELRMDVLLIGICGNCGTAVPNVLIVFCGTVRWPRCSLSFVVLCFGLRGEMVKPIEPRALLFAAEYSALIVLSATGFYWCQVCTLCFIDFVDFGPFFHWKRR